MLAGTKITNPNDTLHKITVEYLYNSLRNPRTDIEAKIRQLRVIRNIDKSAYSRCKRELPYIVCGVFNPPYRRTENFAYTEHFIIDIDHISEKGLDINAIRNTFEKDERVLLLFSSPGEDGLKVMFRLKKRCTEPSLYSLFYKKFTHELSNSFHLEQVIDDRTSDVCRACFISIDSHAYYNPRALPIDIEGYVDEENTMQFFEDKRTIAELQNKSSENLKPEEPSETKAVDDTDIARIKEILKLAKPKPEKPPVIESQQLTEIMDDLKRYIEKSGVIVTEVININYWKKIRRKLGMRLAEINVFCGRRGYSVVISPRTGTNMELNEMMHDYIEGFFTE